MPDYKKKRINRFKPAPRRKRALPTDEDIKVLEVAHYRKIDLSDGIYVVNIDGHIGNSVRKEIEYAKKHNKEVIYHI